jgi:hypothetical protein
MLGMSSSLADELHHRVGSSFDASYFRQARAPGGKRGPAKFRLPLRAAMVRTKRRQRFFDKKFAGAAMPIAMRAVDINPISLPWRCKRRGAI